MTIIFISLHIFTVNSQFLTFVDVGCVEDCCQSQIYDTISFHDCFFLITIFKIVFYIITLPYCFVSLSLFMIDFFYHLFIIVCYLYHSSLFFITVNVSFFMIFFYHYLSSRLFFITAVHFLQK